MIITLCGFMGCGKSSIGKELAKLRGCPFLDLDEIIEQAEGMTINSLFSERGEQGFRELESTYLKETMSDAGEEETILSLGGGTPIAEDNAKLIKNQSFNVYLRATLDTLTTNLSGNTEGRPLLKGRGDLRKRISEMQSARAGVYDRCAKLIMDIDGMTFTEAASVINDKINQLIQ